MKGKKELTLEMWDNGHVVNAQLTNYNTGRALLIVSGSTKKEVFEKIGDYFLTKAQIVRQKKSAEKCGVF